MGRPFTPFAIWLPALLALCGGCDQSKRLEQVQKSINSWSATLDIATEQWGQRRVPRTFVRQIVQAAERSLDKDEKQLAKVSADPTGREQVRDHLVELRHRLHDLSSAIENNDPASARMPSRPPDPPSETGAVGGRS